MTVPSDPAGRPGRPWSQFLVLALFGCLVLIPLMYYGFSGERARWKLARARLLYNDGQTSGAIDKLEEALALTPQDDELQLELARMWMRHGQAERALQLIDESLERHGESMAATELKANCLVYLGRTDEALATAKATIDEASPGQTESPLRLNYLAYFRALAGNELVAARRDIDRAVDRTAREMWWLDGLPMYLEDQTLVATAMVARHIDRPEIVLPILDRRIGFFEDLAGHADRRLNAVVYRSLIAEFPLVESQADRIRREVIAFQAEKRQLAILLSVRALINQDLDQMKLCDRDRGRVQQLGWEAEELIGQLPDDWQLLYFLYNGSQLLDTRAVVKFRTSPQQWRSSLDDLDTAVMALEVLNLSLADSIQNTVRNESGDIYDGADLPRQLAAILKHRANLWQAMGDQAQAQTDRERIQELGFDLDEVLF